MIAAAHREGSGRLTSRSVRLGSPVLQSVLAVPRPEQATTATLTTAAEKRSTTMSTAATSYCVLRCSLRRRNPPHTGAYREAYRLPNHERSSSHGPRCAVAALGRPHVSAWCGSRGRRWRGAATLVAGRPSSSAPRRRPSQPRLRPRCLERSRTGVLSLSRCQQSPKDRHRSSRGAEGTAARAPRASARLLGG